MRTIMRRALTPLAVFMLAACGADNDKTAADGTAAPEASSRTLAATLQGAEGYGSLGRAVSNAGLTGVLEGVGPYTLFAPADSAFTTGGSGDFADESLRAESAALLRAHIVPGALTRSDIAAALQRDSDGKVQMRTMAGTMLTFSREGDVVTLTSDSGASARLSGRETVASNGVLQPVDALLVKADASAAPAAP